jgi:hypothetical protein
MATLVSAIVRGALLDLNAIDAAAAVPGQDMEDAIAVLNRMIRRWEASGLALGWSDVSAPDDEMPSPSEAEDAIIHNLAVRLPGYAHPSDFGRVVDLAAEGLAELRRDRLVEMPLRVTNDLPCPENGGYWNIYTDSPIVR